jgi:hypothetical protein
MFDADSDLVRLERAAGISHAASLLSKRYQGTYLFIVTEPPVFFTEFEKRKCARNYVPPSMPLDVGAQRCGRGPTPRPLRHAPGRLQKYPRR